MAWASREGEAHSTQERGGETPLVVQMPKMTRSAVATAGGWISGLCLIVLLVLSQYSRLELHAASQAGGNSSLIAGRAGGATAEQAHSERGDSESTTDPKTTHETQSSGEAGGTLQEHPQDPNEPDVFNELFGHVVPHPGGGAFLESLGFHNVNLFQLYSLLLMIVLFLFVRNGLLRSLQSGEPMGKIQSIFSGFVLFIRDEMVRPVLGEDKARFATPYFLYLFFFVTFMNLFGLIPGGITATSSIFVTGALAATTFAIMLGGGMWEQGPVKFWVNLVPHGLPGALWPLMFVVEIIGLIVKPFALMIRLFANMTGGHLVVLAFMGLIFYFSSMMGSLAYAIAVPAVGFAVFIMIIEAFVALLQAYIFTYLSILFIGMCLHPEH